MQKKVADLRRERDKLGDIFEDARDTWRKVKAELRDENKALKDENKALNDENGELRRQLKTERRRSGRR